MLASSLLIGIMAQGSGAPPALPAIANISARWSADAITPQSDNTALASWTDTTANAYVASQATGANQPKYRTNCIGTNKPGVQFSGTTYLNGLMPGLKTIVDAKTYSVFILVSQVAVRSNATAFGNSVGGDSFTFQATGALVGRFKATTTELRGPYTDTVNPISMGYTSSPTKIYTGQSGTGLERSYLNGMCVTSNVTAGPATSSASGAFGIGCINDVNQFPFQGYIHEIIVWNKVLSQNEMLQAEIAIRTQYGMTMPWASAPRTFHWDGDSITVGLNTPSVATSYPYLNAQSLGLSYGQWSNQAVGGIQTSDMNVTAGKLADWTNIGTLTGKPMRVIAFEWYNEKIATKSPATIFADMQAYCTNLKAMPGLGSNFKLCIGSSSGYSGDAADPYSTVRGAYNALMDANVISTNMADAYVAIHADSVIGDGNAYATNSATYWSDVVHPNAAGRIEYARVMLPGASAINS